MQLRYFAWVREKLGCEHETIQLPQNVTTIKELINHLASRDEIYGSVFGQIEAIRAAKNDELVAPDTPINDTDDIALFPPMTGG